MTRFSIFGIIILSLLLLPSCLFSQTEPGEFKTAIYTRAYEVQKMADDKWLESTWKEISGQIKVDKIYLETHRDLLIVDRQILNKAISFFKSKGLEVAGGITYTIDESNQFQTFCYSNPEIRNKAKEIIEYSAEFFDEIILDDFFFTSCKCEHCIKGRGDRSWTDYRLDLMTGAAKDVIVNPARKINPNVKVIIKYPNWYDHFHALGFNLETEPLIFDGLYSGTETRDAVLSNQHLQPYLSYLVFRYFNNLKPGKNGGGWVDTGGMRFYERYAEQIWLTLFSKAPEITLFDYRQMLTPLRKEWISSWNSKEGSFDAEEMMKPLNINGKSSNPTTIARAAGYSIEKVAPVIGKLGKPYGIKSYKPFHSTGEDFLQNYLGMIGIPVDIVPYFPVEDDVIILTEQANTDTLIVEKIKSRLEKGKDVIITSGLLNAIQDKGFNTVVDLRVTQRKALVSDYLMSWSVVKSESTILIPQIEYKTNDSWEIISGINGNNGWPILHQCKYGNATLYVLVIPDNFSDIYNFPTDVLNKIREIFLKKFKVTFEGEAMVSMFLYDNNKIVLHSFNNEKSEVKIVLDEKDKIIKDLLSGDSLASFVRKPERFWGKQTGKEKYVFTINIPPHSFKAISIE